MLIHRATLAFLLSLSLVSFAIAQAPATTRPTAAIRALAAPAAPAKPTTSPLLGERFQSAAAGIALNGPKGATAVRGQLGSQEIVRFVSEEKKSVMKVSRILLEDDKPLPLTKWRDPQTGKDQPGMHEWIIQQLQKDTPGAEILRQDTTTIGQGNTGEMAGKANVGLMAARYNLGLETNLIQQALIRVTDLQYYLVSLTSPAPRDKAAMEDDPGVRDAVATFSDVVDSIELIDQTEIRDDQDQRLYRTRQLFLNLTRDKLTRSLKGEQWLRVQREGKDVGYSYVVEETHKDLPRKGELNGNAPDDTGVRIGVRSRMMVAPGVQSDGESWLFCTFDRKYEAFSSLSYGNDPKLGATTVGELGTSRKRTRAIADRVVELGKAPTASLTEEYRLEVAKVGPNVASDPIVRELPPYYLPQALGQLLPRLVPLHEPRTYLFGTWVSDAGQIMYRYVDVKPEQVVKLAGRPSMRAIPIDDHVGLEGSITTHYMAPDGTYLGSVNPDAKITIVPTDAATLLTMWKDANLSRPGDVEQK